MIKIKGTKNTNTMNQLKWNVVDMKGIVWTNSRQTTWQFYHILFFITSISKFSVRLPICSSPNYKEKVTCWNFWIENPQKTLKNSSNKWAEEIATKKLIFRRLKKTQRN